MPLAPAPETSLHPLSRVGGICSCFCRGGAGLARIGSAQRRSDQVETLFVHFHVDIYFCNGTMGPQHHPADTSKRHILGEQKQIPPPRGVHVVGDASDFFRLRTDSQYIF